MSLKGSQSELENSIPPWFPLQASAWVPFGIPSVIGYDLGNVKAINPPQIAFGQVLYHTATEIKLGPRVTLTRQRGWRTEFGSQHFMAFHDHS